MDRRLPEDIESAKQILDGSHLSEHALEEYSLGKVSSEETLATVEEHLLVCAYCADRLESFDEFHSAAKTVLEVKAKQPNKLGLRSVWLLAFAASIVAILILPPALKQNDPAVAVDLAAVRNAPASAAPSNRSLILNLDLTGLADTSYKWELFSSSGQVKTSGAVDRASHKISIAGLPPGQYWLRLKLVSSAQVEREFSLLVR